MKLVWVWTLFTLLACSSSPAVDAGMLPNDSGPAVLDSGTPDAGPACGPKALCTRTITECKAALTQAACEGYYANKANCLDMAGYTYCNCYCITEATCGDYFTCGQLCFNDYCR